MCPAQKALVKWVGLWFNRANSMRKRAPIVLGTNLIIKSHGSVSSWKYVPVNEKNGHENVKEVREEARPPEDDPLRQVRDGHAEGEAGGVDLGRDCKTFFAGYFKLRRFMNTI